jgi:hypothetical protein
MPIQTDLSVSPYFDDYQEDKDYYKILFQPSVPVQVRELNQLQTLLQKQIEKFGDHIVKRGSVLNGCQFNFQTAIPYVKIKDATAAGSAAAPKDYEGFLIRNSANLVARVIASNTGFESQDPNLKTLYLDYLNSGTSSESGAYTNNQVLTVYSSNKRLHKVSIINASQGFSNNDSVVFLSAIEVQNTTGGTTFASGGFSAGDTITQDTTNARAEIVSVDTTSNTTATVLKIKPVTGELSIGNTDSWSFGTGITFNNGSGAEGVLSGFVGTGATGSLLTTGAGAIDSVTVVTGGENYYVDPHVTISTTSASNTQIDNLDLTGDAHLANVTVAAVTSSTGSAYGVNVTEGTVYQKGYFMRVEDQFIIIDRYANTPNAISVGFTTTETVANSAVDPSLVDNAAGFLNQNAPGANRLKLVPTLSVKTQEEADEDSEFLSLVKFSEGRYYLTNPTQYDRIADEFARRTYEESGNYVLDKFYLTTRSTLSIANSDTHFSYVVDPGHAYINGYRVKTDRNYAVDVEKGTDTDSLSNTVFDLVYGNYLLVNEFSGHTDFQEGAQVSLRNAAVKSVTDYPDGGAIAAVNPTEIGKARIRSVMYHGGSDQGTPGAIYRLYLFDVRMNAGKNFVDVRSIVAGSNAGVADIIPETVNTQTGAQTGAKLQLTENNSLLFHTGRPLSSVSANVEYQYRTVKTNQVVQTGGTFSISADSGTVFPYSGNLSSFEENQLIVSPEEDLVSNVSIVGANTTITPGNSSVDSIISSNNATFIADLDPGDYIQVTDGSSTAIAFVNKTPDDETIVYSPNTAFDSLGDVTDIFRCYPNGIPVPMSRRTEAFANTSVDRLTMTLDLDITMSATANVAVTVNQRSNTDNTVVKSAQRNTFVQIDCSNNVAGSTGPWCLGFADIIRLRKVYAGSNTSGTDVTNNFYINHKQNENFYDLGELVLDPSSTLTVNSSSEFLVEFDYTSHGSEGVKTIRSYTINDEVELSSLTTDINTLEIPELTNQFGGYKDIRECIDFRPVTSNTVAATSNSEIAPLNPPVASEATRFSGNNLKFPVPESDFFCDLTYYVGRQDMIVLNEDGEFEILKASDRHPDTSKSQLTLYSAVIPPYPSLPANLSDAVAEIEKTRMNQNGESVRLNKFSITTSAVDQQNPGYTMEEIGQLEKRISVLEYYANISELEDGVKNSVIPSSVDTTLERFKFGFFVENFADEKQSYSDFEHPQYNASIYESNLHPAREQINIDLKLSDDDAVGSNGSSASYVDSYAAKYRYNSKTVLTQSNATAGPVIVANTTPVPTPNTTPVPEANTTIGTTCIYITNNNRANDGRNSTVYQDTVFTLSANIEADSTDVTIEFNVFGGKDRFEIYQSQSKDSGYSLIYTNETLKPTNLTRERRRELQNLKLQPLYTGGVTRDRGSFDYSGRWNSSPNWSYVSNNANFDYWVKNVGKLTFPYDFSAGRYIKVRVVKGSPLHSYYICFPGDVRTFETATTDDGQRLPKFVTPKYNRPRPRPTLYKPIRPVICKPAPTPTKPTITIDKGIDKTLTPVPFVDIPVINKKDPIVTTQPIGCGISLPIKDTVDTKTIPPSTPKLDTAVEIVYGGTGSLPPSSGGGSSVRGAGVINSIRDPLNSSWKLK